MIGERLDVPFLLRPLNSSQRQSDRERRSLFAGVDRDVSTVGDQDLVDYREAKACSLLLRGEKWQENLVFHFLRNTMAGI